MRRYLLKRVFLFFPTLLGLLTLVFLLGRTLPGDPVDLMLGENAAPEARAALRKALRLDEPMLDQYGGYLGDLAVGRLGVSLRSPPRRRLRPLLDGVGREARQWILSMSAPRPRSFSSMR